MRHVLMCGLMALAAACGPGGSKGQTERRMETKAQFQKRALDCATYKDAASCAAESGNCRWQGQLCNELYPPMCAPARCVPDTTNCVIVSPDGTETSCDSETSNTAQGP